MHDLIQLTVTNGKPTTTSLQVAERFGKLHKNVLQSIEQLECPEDFNRLNFQPIARTDDRNRIQPAYAITKDGFMFLAMGFTGKEAAAWKVRFIEAFNAMEAQLLASAAAQQMPRAGAPHSLHHRADNLVAASRTFNAMLRAGTAARMPLPAALRRAAAIAQRETGVDLLDELGAAEYLHTVDEDHAAKQRHASVVQQASPWRAVAHEHVQRFYTAVQSGELGDVWGQPMLSTQFYAMYQCWCQRHGIAYPQRMAAVVGPAVRQGLRVHARKRYTMPDGRTVGPSSFLYPLTMEVNTLLPESEWLGQRVAHIDGILKAIAPGTSPCKPKASTPCATA